MGNAPRTLLPLLPLLLAIALITGFVDGFAFLRIGGVVASFMSGNSTIIGATLINGGPATAAMMAGAMLLAFLGGVVGAAIATSSVRPAYAYAGIAGGAALLLVLSLAASSFAPRFAAPPLAAAMGALHILAARMAAASGGVWTTPTQMLIALGESLTQAIIGAGRPHDCLPWIAHWLAIVAGALIAGIALWRWGPFALLSPIAALVVLALWLAMRWDGLTLAEEESFTD